MSRRAVKRINSAVACLGHWHGYMRQRLVLMPSTRVIAVLISLIPRGGAHYYHELDYTEP